MARASSPMDAMQDENQDPNVPREGIKRKMELDMNDVAPNCFFVSESVLDYIVQNSGDGTDGLVMGFASNMNSIGAIPEETFQHVSVRWCGAILPCDFAVPCDFCEVSFLRCDFAMRFL